MFGLTSLGVVHTAISLVAVAAGIRALVKIGFITANNTVGKVYLVTTFLTAATGLGIFQHGGFGPPHALAILTLLALAVGSAASFSALFGKRGRLVETVCYSSTFLFHMIPGFTESLTRLPPGAPLLPSAEAPEFKPIYGVLFVLFGIGLALQIRRLRARGTGAA